MIAATLERTSIPTLGVVPTLEMFEAIGGILKDDGSFASGVEILRDGIPLIYIDLDLGFGMPHFDRPAEIPPVRENSVLEILVDGEVYYQGNSQTAVINKLTELEVFAD